MRRYKYHVGARFTEEEYKAAEDLMKKCSRVIYSGVEFGAMNRANKRLLEEAKMIGKKIEIGGKKEEIPRDFSDSSKPHGSPD